MPLSPAARTTAKVRYGLHAGSGERYSMRVESLRFFFGTGTRTSAERLLRAQLTYTGASYPATNRLYELTHWLVTAVISDAWRSSPAMKLRAVLDRLKSSPGPWNALISPSNSEK